MYEEYKYAIFDFDGTIADSMWLWDQMDLEILKRYQIVPDSKVRNKVKKLSILGTAQFFVERYGLLKTTNDLKQEILELASEKYKTSIELKPYVKELIREFHSEGIRMCIATVASRMDVERVLHRHGIRSFFEFIVTAEEAPGGKNSPEIFEMCIQRFGAAKDNTIIFEDALHAVKTAKDAGFHVVAVYDDSSKEDIFKISRLADKYINNFSEILVEDVLNIQNIMEKRDSNMRRVLAIAGSDCSGGAGIQADLKTITAHKQYGMSVITALTAQNTLGVNGIMEVPADFVNQQLDAVFEDIFPEAVKIGMLSNKEIIESVAARLYEYRPDNIVLDPVMISTSGSRLLNEDAVTALIKKLMPLAELITPNIPEAEVLSGVSIETKNDMICAAKKIYKNYTGHILIKGGHLPGSSDDLLYYMGNEYWFEQENVENENNHGTGCTLSSAIACNLAEGKDMITSIYEAKDYITGALQAGLNLGKGSGPINHCWKWI